MKTKIRNFTFCAVLIAAASGLFFSCSSAPSSSLSRPSSGAGNSGTGSSGSSQQMSRAALDRQAAYMQVLRNEGFLPDIDSDGDIIFKREGRSYYIIIGKNDPALIQLLLPNIASVDDYSSRDSAARAISGVNRKTKVAKAFFYGSNRKFISLSVELFLEDQADFGQLFSRMTRLLETAEENLES